MSVVALLLVLLHLAGAPAPAPPAVAGHYVLENAHEMGSDLVLKPDGQFDYTMTHGAADYRATGKWHIAGETVVLNSKLVEGTPFKLLRSADLRSPDLRVWVTGLNGKAVANLDVTMTAAEGESKARTDRDGMALFPGVSNPKSVVIHVPVYDKDSSAIAVNSSHTDFYIELNGDALATVPFRGEVLKINGDALEMLYWDKTKPPMVYRKQGN
jgi:hypothetical protein